MKRTIYETFSRASKTYFYSSIFFEGQTKDDVFTLYAFVRKADDYVDTIPQKKGEFYKLKNDYRNALHGQPSSNEIIDSFVELVQRRRLKPDWVDAFLWSMESDLVKSTYHTIEELKKYLYGSAEVVGLMMAKILNLPPASYPAARYLGRSMQYINFIRDIQEDIALGRTYLPKAEQETHGLASLRYEHAVNHPVEYEDFIHSQIKRYFSWQRKAENGFGYIPKRFFIPIKTASDMYKWTAQQIDQNPYIVYNRKIKPSIPRIVLHAICNLVTISISS
jgi:phytoene synthase